MDMTMYAEYSPANVGSLQPYGVVVNVHTRSRDGLARWEAKMQRYGGGPVVEERIRRVRRDYDELAQPLEFGCPRVDVSTFSGYEPALAEVVLAIEAEHRAVPPCSTHMQSARPNGGIPSSGCARLRRRLGGGPWTVPPVHLLVRR